MLVRQPRADDSDEFFIPLRVDDDHESSIDGADRDETVFDIRMLSVEYLEVVDTRFEESASFCE